MQRHLGSQIRKPAPAPADEATLARRHDDRCRARTPRAGLGL